LDILSTFRPEHVKPIVNVSSEQSSGTFQSRVNEFCDLLDEESAQERRNERKNKRARLTKQLQELDNESEEDTKNVRE
jgi:hypothetical protein